MYTGIIYLATSPSGKKYYGKTVGQLKNRIAGHKRNSQISNCHFSTAIRKYGIKKFNWDIIETYTLESRKALRKILNEREIYWIKQDNTIVRTIGYNMTIGGDGGAAFGRKLSEETKKKISNSLKGKIYSEERRENMSKNGKGISRNKNRKLSEETKKKISQAQKGRKLSEETKKKMSESQKGRVAWNKGKPAWNRGVPATVETKKKMSESLKGRVAWNKGKRNK